MLQKRSLSVVVTLIAVCFIVVVTLIHIYPRSTFSLKGPTRTYIYENEKWMNSLSVSYISDWYPRMQTETKQSNPVECVALIQLYLYKNVTDKLLKTILTKCFLSGIIKETVSFNISFIKTYLETFSCPTALFFSTPRPLVALASYPGSGNTWTRELIEALTGTLTGSIYSDWNFKGSEPCPAGGSIYIVKTHKPSDDATSHVKCRDIGVSKLNYTKAVLILRNPYHALLAEFNRVQSLKFSGNPGVGIAPKSDYKTSRWENFVRVESETWKHMAIYWLTEFRKPVYVLVYEDLWKYTAIEMYKLSRFLNNPTTFKSLYCLSGNSVGKFKRRKPTWLSIEALFDHRLRKVVNDNIRSVLEVYDNPQLYNYIFEDYQV